MSGTTSEVAGMRSLSSSTKTVNERRILMHREIFSPLSLGR